MKFKEEVIKNMLKVTGSDVKSQFLNITRTIKLAAEKQIPKEESWRSQSSHWLREEIKELMRKQRLVKHSSSSQYNLVNKELKKKCEQAKENWSERKCEEVERLEINPKEMFQEIREISGKRLAAASRCIKSDDGRVLQNQKDIWVRQEEYIRSLFYDKEEEETVETGPSILK